MITISTLIAVPAIAAVVLLVVPFARQAAGYLALLVSLAVLGAVIGFIYRFEPVAGYQFADNVSWIEPLGVRWHVAVNGVSLAMIAVTALITTCALGFALWAKRDRSHASAALILMTEAFLFLVFAARDLFAFYVGFEGMLIPLLVLLVVWGGPGRKFATLQVIAYTAFGTLLMLLGILYLGLTAPDGPNFDMAAAIGRGGDWVFFAFAIAFAIKSPLFPLHGWVLPAYRESSPEVAAVLSGVASKAGAFAFLAVLVPLFPAQAANYLAAHTEPLVILQKQGRIFGVKFVVKFADDLLNQILNGDHAGGAAVLVDHNRHVDMAALQLCHHFLDQHRIWHKLGRVQNLA